MVDHDPALGGMALLTGTFAALGFVVALRAWRRGLRRLDGFDPGPRARR